MERKRSFQSEVKAIMNTCIRSDYSAFERCLALYEYIARNYTYYYDYEVDASEDGSGCDCLKYKKGIYADFALQSVIIPPSVFLTALRYSSLDLTQAYYIVVGSS